MDHLEISLNHELIDGKSSPSPKMNLCVKHMPLELFSITFIFGNRGQNIHVRARI